MLIAAQERGSLFMSGDILNQIDEVVDQARQDVCACGCGRTLSPDGPSLYYAEQSCQFNHTQHLSQGPYLEQWGTRDGHDLGGLPHLREAVDRERRRIAEDHQSRRRHYDSLFNLDLVLSASSTIHEPTHAPPAFLPDSPFRAHIQAASVPAGLHRLDPNGYRSVLQFARVCPGCNTTSPVRSRVHQLSPARYRSDQVTQCCVVCDHRYDQAVLGVWGYTQGWVVLTVEHRGLYAMSAMGVSRLDRSQHPRRLARATWVSMTMQVLGGRGRSTEADDRDSPGFDYARWLERMAQPVQ